MAATQNSTTWAKHWAAAWNWIGQARWSGQPDYLTAWRTLRDRSWRRSGSVGMTHSGSRRTIWTCVCGSSHTASSQYRHREAKHVRDWMSAHTDCYLDDLRQITGGLTDAELARSEAEAEMARCREALMAEVERYRHSLAAAEREIAALTEIHVPEGAGSRWPVIEVDA